MYHSYMVRIWREAGWKADEFQILVESVQSGETYQFDDLNSLKVFLQGEINRGDAPEIGHER